MEENLSFGYWVRRRRKALDMTQAELGRRAGASAAMIRKIEAGERRPSREMAEALADQLLVPLPERAAFLRAARDIMAVEHLPAAGNPPPRMWRTNLPAPMTSLVNRVSALAEVTALLLNDGVRLVTISGPPGMGKTRLSIQVARQLQAHFQDGVWFIDLSAIIDPDQVLPAIALALDLAPAPGLSPAKRVELDLSDKQMLLVVDNLEQVVESAALDVANLLRACPDLKVLATSRVRLDVYGEHEYPLPGMTLPPAAESYTPGALLQYEAVQLFVDRARQYDPHFVITPETAVSVAQICRQMDGLPLALELAAARTRQTAVTELAAALRRAFGHDWHALLYTSARDLPPRQQTLFNAVAWSYNLLAEEEQLALRLLGVFEGGFDDPAASAVCYDAQPGQETSALPLLDLLVDRSLVSLESRRPKRWRLLEMIREFARSLLSAEELRAAKGRHAHHYAARLREWSSDWSDPGYLRVIDTDLDNYRAALHTALEEADAVLAFTLGIALGHYWERRGLLFEGRSMLDRVLGLPGEVDPHMRILLQHEAIILAWMQHDFATAETLSTGALAFARSSRLPQATALLLNLLGRIYLEQARYAEADQVLVEGIELSHSLAPPRPAYFESIQRGEAALGLGDLDLAQHLTVEGLKGISEYALIPYCMGWNNLAEIALACADTPAARAALRHVLPQVHQHARRARIFLVSVAGFLILEYTLNQEHMINAALLLSYVSTVNDRQGDPLSPLTQAQLAKRVTAVERTLPQDTWRTAWQEGQHWTQEKALAAAGQALEMGL